ncbi:S1C family serine protease [Terriglobus sp.]|uniref:S1C family serine protease n=1 Tax=Terriglobus sp. TaxID=1889013 RepID=UPI003AFFFE86
MPYFSAVLSLVVLLSSSSLAQAPVASKDVLEKATQASVLILTGEGSGRLSGIGTGVLVSDNGTILTALHVIKNQAEVQVRLANGDVFDNVQMLGIDERRDIAALRISGRNLPHLTCGSEQPATGDSVFAVTNANGLAWSATTGMVSAVRPAEEVSGAGSGYRVIQFNATIAPGASGGALLGSKGELLGIITHGMVSGVGFAVPSESVLGLADAPVSRALGSGALLKTPAQTNALLPANSSDVTTLSPQQLIARAKTVYLHSKTSFLTIDTLQRALLANKRWNSLGLTIVGDPRLADLKIEVDRPLFTYVHTFVLSDNKTTIVLGSGKQTAFDGTTASSGLAKDIVAILAPVRNPKQKDEKAAK